MVKKVLVACGLSVFFFLLGHSLGFAADPGPEDILLKSSTADTKPPAVFPHKLHQQTIECGECHHGMEDGKKVPYTEGMEIKKCESCHNQDVLGGRKEGNNDLATFKGAGHGNCLECHKKVAKEDDSKKKLKSCNTCHKK